MSPAQRRNAGSRRRASWLPRLLGIGVVVVLAGAGVIAYVAGVRPHAVRHRTTLPSRVVSGQTVGLVTQTASSSPQLLQLLDPHGRPGFLPLSAGAAAAPGTGQWTANQMADGSYIFIFLPSGDCLTAVGPPARPALTLAHCELTAQQRWRRTSATSQSDQHAFFQYANLADGKCLGETGPQAGGEFGAGLTTCSASPDADQFLAFWWSTA